MSEDLYDFEVLRLAAGITRVGRLASPHARVVRESRVCGSRIAVELAMEGGVVVDYAQEIEACALGQAVASAIAATIVGQTGAGIRVAAAQFRRMIKQRGEAPTGDWAALAALAPAVDIPTRHASVLLPFDAVEAAIGAIESSQPDDGQPLAAVT